MAERAVYNEGFNTIAIPQDTGETRATIGAISSVTSAIVDISQKHEDLKLTNFATKADNEMLEATAGLRNKYALDPTGEKARKETDDTYNKILNKYDEQVGFMSKGQWAQRKEQLKLSYSRQNSQWAIRQSEENATNNANDAIKNSLDKSYALGMSGNTQEAVASFQANEMQLRKDLEGILPADVIAESMKNYTRDNVKSYIMGVSARSPEDAMVELKGKTAQAHLTAEDTVKLEEMIFTQQKKMTLKTKQEQFDNHSKFDEEVKDIPNVGLQVQALQKGVEENRYDADWAKSKEDALLSSKGVTAVSREETQFDLINKKTSIVASRKDMDPEEYLLAVRNFEIEVNQKIAEGNLRYKDGMKIINSVKQDDGKNYVIDKSSSLEGGNNGVFGFFVDFGQDQANKMFEKSKLTTISRQNATIDFFYLTQDNPNLTNDEKRSLAEQIIKRYETIDLSKKVQGISSGIGVFYKNMAKDYESIEEVEKLNLPVGSYFKIKGEIYQVQE